MLERGSGSVATVMVQMRDAEALNDGDGSEGREEAETSRHSLVPLV